MAIPLPDQSSTPAGDFVNRQVLGETVAAFIDNLKTALVDAGWTAAALSAYNILTATGQPSNAQTCTVDGVVYTFKTSINNSNPREVLIDATWQETMQNLVACVNAGAGSGTKYSSATTAHTTCAAYWHTNSTVYIYAITPGTGGNGITVAEAMSNAAFTAGSTSVLVGGGQRLTSAKSADGHRVAMDFRDEGGSTTTISVHIGDPYNVPGDPPSSDYDNANWSAWEYLDRRLLLTAGRYYRVIASMYSAWISVPGSSGANLSVGATLVKVPDIMQAKPITAATGGGGSLVTITQAGHGMLGTGNVYIYGAEGFLIDGFWNVTVVDLDTYTLDDSTGVAAGSYVASSAVGADVNAGQVARAFFGWWASNSVNIGPRYALASINTPTMQAVNQYGFRGTYHTSWPGSWAILFQDAKQWFDARYWIQEAPVFAGPDATSARQGIGYLYGACLLSKQVPMDTQAVDSDGQKWHAYTAQTTAAYSLLVAIPATEN